MIAFVLYAVVIFILIWRNGFFGVLSDQRISNKTFSFLFLGKIVAVPVFFMVYKLAYGGITNFDTGKFYNDVKVITDHAKENPFDYLRLLFGFQNDQSGSHDYNSYLKNTLNWDNGTVKDFFYNDNRIVIRVHSLIEFIAFQSYLVHALINCFISFIGIVWIYKAFKRYFEGKEMLFLLTLCFFPALWFYTGAMLKEGLCLFVMGCFVYNLQIILGDTSDLAGSRFKNYFLLFASIVLSFYLKAYLLLPFILTMGFFIILDRYPVKRKRLLFILTLILFLATANVVVIQLKNRSLPEAALQHQKRFMAVSRGGIFFNDSGSYVQLKPDTSQIFKRKDNSYGIKKGVSYMYWRPGKPKDTLYVTSNTDTSKAYELIYIIPESNSNINVNVNSPTELVTSALYHSLFFPMFFNAKGILQVLASLENLAIIAAIIILIFATFRSSKDKLLPLAFTIFALALCLLAGISAPNSGAIFRYRAPAIVFLLLAALYNLNLTTFKRRFVK